MYHGVSRVLPSGGMGGESPHRSKFLNPPLDTNSQSPQKNLISPTQNFDSLCFLVDKEEKKKMAQKYLLQFE